MAGQSHSRELLHREAEAFAEGLTPPRSHGRRPQSWLTISLPNLALDALGDFSHRGPVAAAEPDRDRLRIAAVNAAAQAAGVRPGIDVGAALAFDSTLEILPRSIAAEQACLQSFAAWAQWITPLVGIEPPDALSLEVGGSLKLFGGLASVKQALEAELAQRRWTHRMSVAPTPLASLWLARGGAADILEHESLAARVGALPLSVTGWPPDVRALLTDMGIRTVGECCRLPRGGFARRAGRGIVEDLDKALGKRFDPRCGYTPPAHWHGEIELPQECRDAALLLAALGGMLNDLAAKLRRDQAQIESFDVRFAHRRAASTVLRFDLLEPSSCKDRLMSLIRDRLERLALAEPALAVSLDTGALQPLRLCAPDLFSAKAGGSAGSLLIERLRARFGRDAVHGVAAAADHRPERAWAAVLDDLFAPRRAAPPPLSPWVSVRPLWLLPAPLPLGSREARCHYEGKLELVSEPERIESGWWDDHDANRDYYTAAGAHGQRLWIFRDGVSGRWHLHGLFG